MKIETKRLVLREFNLNDANFILKLLNTPTWLRFIGDKQVYSLADAQRYIKSELIASYKANGYGLWKVSLKDSLVPIGMCGLLRRETLEHADIGFALLPEYEQMGYGYESANAVMDYAKDQLKLDIVLAITDAENISSIGLLKKIGLHFMYTKELAKNDTVLVFSNEASQAEKSELDT